MEAAIISPSPPNSLKPFSTDPTFAQSESQKPETNTKTETSTKTAEVAPSALSALKPDESKLTHERIKIKKKLLEAHKALVATAHPDKKLIIERVKTKNYEDKSSIENFSLKAIDKVIVLLDAPDNKKNYNNAMKYMYGLFDKANDLKVSHFFSDDGHLYSIEDLIQLIHLRCDKELEIKKEKNDLYSLADKDSIELKREVPNYLRSNARERCKKVSKKNDCYNNNHIKELDGTDSNAEKKAPHSAEQNKAAQSPVPHHRINLDHMESEDVDFQHIELVKKYIKSLPKEDAPLLASGKDKLGYLLLTKVYPISEILKGESKLINSIVLKTLVVSPSAFLSLYQDLISTPKLLQFGAIILESSEIDPPQKMRILHTFSTLFKYNLYPKDVFLPEINSSLANLKEKCFHSKCKEVVRAFNEIQFYFDRCRKPLLNNDFQSDDHGKDYFNSDACLHKIALQGTHCAEFKNFMIIATKEIALNSASLFSQLTFSSFFFEEDKPTEILKIEEYFNRLFLYVKNIYTRYKDYPVNYKRKDFDISNSDSPVPSDPSSPRFLPNLEIKATQPSDPISLKEDSNLPSKLSPRDLEAPVPALKSSDPHRRRTSGPPSHKQIEHALLKISDPQRTPHAPHSSPPPYQRKHSHKRTESLSLKPPTHFLDTSSTEEKSESGMDSPRKHSTLSEIHFRTIRRKSKSPDPSKIEFPKESNTSTFFDSQPSNTRSPSPRSTESPLSSLKGSDAQNVIRQKISDNVTYLLLSIIRKLCDLNDYNSALAMWQGVVSSDMGARLDELSVSRASKETKNTKVKTNEVIEFDAMLEKYQELRGILGSMDNIRTRIQECRDNQIYCIPPLGILELKVRTTLDFIKKSDDLELSKTNPIDYAYKLHEAPLIFYLSETFERIRNLSPKHSTINKSDIIKKIWEQNVSD